MSDLRICRSSRIGSIPRAGGTASVNLKAGLAAVYRFNNSLVDSWSTHNLANGTPTYTASGFMGQALTGSGGAFHTTTQNILTGNIVQGEYSVAFWTYDGSDGAGAGGVVQMLWTDAGSSDIQLNIYTTDRNMDVELDNLAYFLDPTLAWSADTWHLITFTLKAGTGVLYIDAVADHVNTGMTSANSFNGTYSLKVQVTPGDNTYRFDQLMIWNGHALNSQEVRALYNNGLGVDPSL